MDTTIDKETISLRRIIVGYLHHWKLFLFFFILSTTLAIAYLVLYPTTYEIMARIQLQEDKELGSGSLGLGEAAGLMKSFGLGSGNGSSIMMDDELAKLLSNDLLTRMVTDLGLHVSYKRPYSYNYEMYENVPVLLTPDSLTNEHLSSRITFRINIDKQGKVRVDAKSDNKKEELRCEQLPLNYDRKCFSWNEFRWEANFEAGYSYAAELIPADITVNRVPFHLETKEEMNGMLCSGNTLQLPAGHSYNRLYILAAAATAEEDVRGVFQTGKNLQEIVVPSYTGFIGQWGHTGHTQGYLKDAEVAYVGTHRHSAEGDHAYEFTYMFKFAIDIPAKATEVILPDNKDIVIFAATLVEEPYAPVKALSTLFQTANEDDTSLQKTAELKINLLKPEHIVAWSGYTNDNEKPAFLIDGNENTKWCDTSMLPNYIDFDLGMEKKISGWKMVNAAQESYSYITGSCFLQGRNNSNEAWRTLDFVTGNKQNVINRSLGKTEKVRYLRLLVTQPVQAANGKDTRIYEFAVF